MLTWIANKLTKFVHQYAEDKSHTYSGVRDITFVVTNGSAMISVLHDMFRTKRMKIYQSSENDDILFKVCDVQAELLNDAVTILADISTLFAWYDNIDSSFTYNVQGE